MTDTQTSTSTLTSTTEEKINVTALKEFFKRFSEELVSKHGANFTDEHVIELNNGEFNRMYETFKGVTSKVHTLHQYAVEDTKNFADEKFRTGLSTSYTQLLEIFQAYISFYNLLYSCMIINNNEDNLGDQFDEYEKRLSRAFSVLTSSVKISILTKVHDYYDVIVSTSSLGASFMKDIEKNHHNLLLTESFPFITDSTTYTKASHYINVQRMGIVSKINEAIAFNDSKSSMSNNFDKVKKVLLVDIDRLDSSLKPFEKFIIYFRQFSLVFDMTIFYLFNLEKDLVEMDKSDSETVNVAPTTDLPKDNEQPVLLSIESASESDDELESELASELPPSELASELPASELPPSESPSELPVSESASELISEPIVNEV